MNEALMKLVRWTGVMIVFCALVACGGGGGSGGDSLFGGTTGSGSSGGSGSGTTASAPSLSLAVARSGVTTTTITSTETVQASATVLSAAGTPVQGVVVTFSVSGADLLTFAPTSASALTNAQGVATVDVTASSTGATGATTVTASASVSGATYSGSASISVGASAGVVPSSMNFVSVSPSDSAIVIQGTGGNGRSESATLTFRAVDGSNAPVSNAKVYFRVDNPSAVTLNVVEGTTDSSGLVTTTVTSKTTATSVVVIAEARSGSTVVASAQSDSLLISNGVAVAEAFEVVAEKYNLDGRFTGDTTQVSAYVADANGNPVPDGVAVSFTTDAGAVGSSTQGGCTTVNGTCSVQFRVQNPRLNGIATVIGQILVSGGSTVLSDSIQINLAGASGGTYFAEMADGSAIPAPYFMSSCSETMQLRLQDGNDRSPAAGTTISAVAGSGGVTGTVPTGSPVQDVLTTGFPPAPFLLTVSAPSTVCGSQTGSRQQGTVILTFTTPHGVLYTQTIQVSVPGPDPAAP